MNSQPKAAWNGQEVMSDKSQLGWAGTWLPLCDTPRCVCISGEGALSTRLLQSYSFRTVPEMLLKNFNVGEFYKMIPVLFVDF